MGAAPATAAGYFPITGTGSTWSQNALDQWRSNVAKNYAMTINYTGAGSTSGRRDFIDGTVDFAISEIPFQSRPEDGSAPEKPSRGYAYMPIVAGGTSFMYNLKISGKRVTNLRLSGDTITKMFTGGITNWNDAAIQADNPALAMPNKKIVPVIRSDGSGTTAQFTPVDVEAVLLDLADGHDLAVPELRQLQGPEGLGRCVRLRLAELRRGRHHLRRVLLRQEGRLPGGEGAQQVRLLRRADRLLGRRRDARAPRSTPTPRRRPTSPRSSTASTTAPTSAPTRCPATPTRSCPPRSAGIFNTNKGNTLGGVHAVRPLRGPAAGGHAGLLAAADEPGAGRLRPDQADSRARAARASTPPSATTRPSRPATRRRRTSSPSIAPQPAACDKKGTSQCSTGTAGAKQDTPVTGTGTGGDVNSDGHLGPERHDGHRPGHPAPREPPQYDENGNVVSRASGTGEAATSTPFTLPDQGMGTSQWLMVVSALLLVAAVVVPPLVSRRLRTGAGDAS